MCLSICLLIVVLIALHVQNEMWVSHIISLFFPNSPKSKLELVTGAMLLNVVNKTTPGLTNALIQLLVEGSTVQLYLNYTLQKPGQHSLASFVLVQNGSDY